MRSAFAVLLLATYLSGQKAEPLAIEFPAGKTSASVKGELKGRQQTEYAVEAREGQSITLQLASVPARTLQLKLYDPRGGEAPLHQSSSRRWSGGIAQNGSYTIAVIRESLRTETSKYTLTVTVH